MLAGSLTRLLAAAALLNALPAHAGDIATLRTLGFSPNGSRFAFEQYGTQDGSGFPYSEIFVIDLDRDRFVAPSPVRVRLEEDGATVSIARAEANAKALTLLTKQGPFSSGTLVAANPPTELSADPHRVEFVPRAMEPSPDRVTELTIERLPLPSDARCEGLGPEISGFRLVRAPRENEAQPVILHEENTIPEARGCPFDYAFSEVRVHTTDKGVMRAVAVIAVKSVGFEGPDLRYIAVPVPLD